MEVHDSVLEKVSPISYMASNPDVIPHITAIYAVYGFVMFSIIPVAVVFLITHPKATITKTRNISVRDWKKKLNYFIFSPVYIYINDKYDGQLVCENCMKYKYFDSKRFEYFCPCCDYR